MAKKKFTSKNIPEIVYEIIGEGWLSYDTYCIDFDQMTDVDGDTYHLEVEFHKDENRVTYTRVYDYENVEAIKEILSLIIPPAFDLFECDEIISKVPLYAIDRAQAFLEYGFKKSDKLMVGTMDHYAYKDYWTIHMGRG